MLMYRQIDQERNVGAVPDSAVPLSLAESIRKVTF